MQPTQHLGNNDVLRAPPGISHDQCQPLPITRAWSEDGRTAFVCSYWRPSPAELALLAAGACVRLEIPGITHPPIHIGVAGDGLDPVPR